MASDMTGTRAFFRDIMSGNLVGIHRWVQQGGDPHVRRDHSDGVSATHVAAWSGNLAVMQYLVYILDVSPFAYTNDLYLPLHVAMTRGHLVMFEWLREHMLSSSEASDNIRDIYTAWKEDELLVMPTMDD